MRSRAQHEKRKGGASSIVLWWSASRRARATRRTPRWIGGVASASSRVEASVVEASVEDGVESDVAMIASFSEVSLRGNEAP